MLVEPLPRNCVSVAVESFPARDRRRKALSLVRRWAAPALQQARKDVAPTVRPQHLTASHLPELLSPRAAKAQRVRATAERAYACKLVTATPLFSICPDGRDDSGICDPNASPISASLAARRAALEPQQTDKPTYSGGIFCSWRDAASSQKLVAEHLGDCSARSIRRNRY